MPPSSLARLRARVMRTLGPRLLHVPGLRPRFIGWRAQPIDGNVCDEDLAALIGLGDLVGATNAATHEPTSARAEMAESSLMVEDEECVDVKVQDRVLVQDGLQIAARTYVPAGLAANSPGIVYYHGGGFVLGDLDTHDRYCQHLAKDAAVRVISIDYRLAPENPFPAGLDDGVAAFRCVARRAREFNLDPDRIAVMGDSAGGNLSAIVAFKTRHDVHKPVLQALIYPAVDGTCAMKSHELFGRGWILESEKMEWFYHCYVGDDPAERRQPDVSPLFADDFQGLSPALVYTAGFDPLRDEGMAYAKRLEKAGIATRHHCFHTLTHGFVSMGGVCPAAREAARQIAHDVGRVLREEGSARTNAAT